MTFNEFKKAGYSMRRVVKCCDIQKIDIEQDACVKDALSHTPSNFDAIDTTWDSNNFEIYDPQENLIFTFDSDSSRGWAEDVIADFIKNLG